MMGFETYTRVLEEAVREVKEEEFRDLFKAELQDHPHVRECVVEAEFDAFIPETYVYGDTERMTIYRRLYALSTDEQLQEVAAELSDRFGKHPPQVENLIGLVRLKLAASRIGFAKIHIAPQRMQAVFPPEQDTLFYESADFQRVMAAISQMREKGARMTQEEKVLTVSVPLDPSGRPGEQLHKALQFLQHLTHSTEMAAVGPDGGT